MLTTIISGLIVCLTYGFHIRCLPEFDIMMGLSKGYFEGFFFLGLFLSLAPWLSMLFLSQGTETHPITMSGLRSNIDDRKMHAYSGGIVITSFLGMFFAVQPFFVTTWSFAGAVISAGILLDLLRMAYCRFQYRRTPEGIVEWFTEVTKRSGNRKDETWHTICFTVPFSLMNVYMKCGAYGSLQLFCRGIAEMSSSWLGSISRLVLFKLPTEVEETLLDRYARAEMDTAKRISWLLYEACALGSLPGFEEITRLTGKLFVSFYKHHKSLGHFLLSLLSQASNGNGGKIALRDQDREIVSTFCEIIKEFLESSVDRGASHAAIIHEVLDLLEKKVKEICDREKNIHLAFLTLPLADIKHMLERAPYCFLPDREEILSDLQSIVERFPG